MCTHRRARGLPEGEFIVFCVQYGLRSTSLFLRTDWNEWRRNVVQRAIDKMVREISSILSDVKPSIYLYGSSVLDDFKLGWSDIDILALTDSQMSEGQAQSLVGLRQAMLADEPGNLYYRSFEGGMLTLDAFLSGAADRVVYWGTSGERVTDRYVFDSFAWQSWSRAAFFCMGRILETS